MTVKLNESYDGKVLTIQMSGKLTAEDYEQFVPLTERLIDQHGRIRILIDMQEFHGWSLAALWEDLKFDIKHFNDIERLAMVGDRTWEKWMATFCKPFTSAEIRYFDQSESDEASQWISDGLSN